MATILCVEDEPALREDLLDELRDAGFEAVGAANGAEGLAEIERRRPDLVICDVTMPVMNGIEMLRALREGEPRLARTPVLFLSALEDVARLLPAGLKAEGFLTKPVDYEVIVASARMFVGASAA